MATLTLIAVVALGRAAAGQELMDEAQWRRGYHGFTALCRASRLVPITDAATWGRVPANRSVLVVLGDPRHSPVDLEAYVSSGGALLVAADRDSLRALRDVGLRLRHGPLETARQVDAFLGYEDCPIISEFHADHPTTIGLSTVPTNRPAAVQTPGEIEGTPWQIVASLPPLRGRILRQSFDADFAVAAETPGGGRAVVLADQSVFTNQMLFHGDNARLAANVLGWLGEGRTAVAIVSEGELIAPPSPQLVMVDVPMPTARDVRALLSELPPELLVEFGNVVATTVEDEGIANDLIGLITRDIPRRQYRRWGILILAAGVGLIALRQVFARHVGDAEIRGGEPRPSVSADRRHAAAELLEAFRADVAGSGRISWDELVSRLTAGSPATTRSVRRTILGASRRLGPRSNWYWSRRRLARLDEQIRAWRGGVESGAIRFGAA